MATQIDKKILHIYTLLEKLANGEDLYPQNENLQIELGVSERTLRRYLEDIHAFYDHIVLTEKKPKEFSDRKVTIYRVVDRNKDVSKILRFFIENSKDLDWLLKLVNDNDPSMLDELDDREELQAVIKSDEEVFLFKTNPFEHMETDEKRKIFNRAKIAVKNREHKNIRYKYDEEEIIKDAKCLKMVFMNNNWYLAIEEEDGHFRFLRLSFILSIEYSDIVKSYPRKILDSYQEFFHTLQNPMTLDSESKTAHIKASLAVARYFRKEMKPFFSSQCFIRENDDGSVEFSVDYTQPMEILPFVKNWQPGLTILSPAELRQNLLDDLNKSLKNHLDLE